MHSLKFIFLSLTFLALFTSCTDDDAGLDFQILNTEKLQAKAGHDLEFSLEFTDDSGIQQVIVNSTNLSLSYFENVVDKAPTVVRIFNVSIPTDATTGELLEVDVEFSDIEGNSVVDNFNIEIL